MPVQANYYENVLATLFSHWTDAIPESEGDVTAHELGMVTPLWVPSQAYRWRYPPKIRNEKDPLGSKYNEFNKRKKAKEPLTILRKLRKLLQKRSRIYRRKVVKAAIPLNEGDQNASIRFVKNQN